MDKKDIKYLIADIETLEDYFSFQYRNEVMSKADIIECYNDDDCYKLYNLLASSTRPMYVFSIDFDAIILNMFCKLVEKPL